MLQREQPRMQGRCRQNAGRSEKGWLVSAGSGVSSFDARRCRDRNFRSANNRYHSNSIGAPL